MSALFLSPSVSDVVMVMCCVGVAQVPGPAVCVPDGTAATGRDGPGERRRLERGGRADWPTGGRGRQEREPRLRQSGAGERMLKGPCCFSCCSLLKIPCPGRAVCVQEAERAYQVYKVRALAEQAAWGDLEAPLGRTRRATVKKHSRMAPIVCLIRRAAKRELPEVEVLGMTGQAASAAQGRKRSRRGCAEQRAAVVHHVAHGLNGDLFKELMGFLHGP